MTTEAQTEANRANAQKSTGPRTPEGKAKVAQNAVKHGLLAKDAVVVREDLDEFELYRAQLRAELAPVGMAESLLVERIVGLFWRLQRAERFHTESFDVLYMQCTADPQIKRWRPLLRPDAADPVVGLTVVKDFSETKVLERLLVYERRIENSLYRTMAELHKVQGQRRSAGGAPMAEADRRGRRSGTVRETLPPDFTLDNLLAKIAALEEGPGSPAAEFRGWEPHQTREDAFGNPEPPAGATTNAPPDPSCETKPISEPPLTEAAAEPVGSVPVRAYPGSGIPSAALSGPARPVNLKHGGDAHATITPDGVTTNRAAAEGPSCETKPISVGPDDNQVPGGEKVEEVGRGRPTYEDPSDGVPTNVLEAHGSSCETKPISAGANRNQGGYRPIFRRRR